MLKRKVTFSYLSTFSQQNEKLAQQMAAILGITVILPSVNIRVNMTQYDNMIICSSSYIQDMASRVKYQNIFQEVTR